MNHFSFFSLILLVLFFTVFSCNSRKSDNGSYRRSVLTSGYHSDSLPQPHATVSSKNFSKPESWPDDSTPVSDDVSNIIWRISVIK